MSFTNSLMSELKRPGAFLIYRHQGGKTIWHMCLWIFAIWKF